MGKAPPDTGVPAIAYRLKVTRLALGLNQTELCDRTGIAKNTYNQWEKAIGRPELDKALLLCAEFGIPLDWIYRGLRSCLPHDLAVRIEKRESAELQVREPGRAASGD